MLTYNALLLLLQVRIPVAEIAAVVRGLVDGSGQWSQVQSTYPAVVKLSEDEGAEA